MIPITRPIRKPPRPSESQLIHPSAWKWNSAKLNFRFTEFANKVSNDHFGDAPPPIEGYGANVAWGGTPREGQDHYLPSL